MITFLISIALGLLPGIAWLVFYLQEDLHPEPKRLILYTFLIGAAFSFIALALQIAANSILPALGIATLSPLSLLALAAIEEIVKFSGVYVAIHGNREFDEPVDAMVYMVVGALGFATVENLGALHGIPLVAALSGNIIEIVSLRFVGATLIHTLTSAIVGYFWALSIRDFNLKRLIVWGLALATLLHAVFNYLILGNEAFAYPMLLVLVVGFFVLNDFESLKQKTL
jgi:RsiW-degrading membrane proteinase PrsW (M82 family)